MLKLKLIFFSQYYLLSNEVINAKFEIKWIKQFVFCYPFCKSLVFFWFKISSHI